MTVTIDWRADDDCKSSIVLDCYAETDGYDTDYGVTMFTVGRHYHGPLVRFVGRRGDLRRLLAEAWQEHVRWDACGHAVFGGHIDEVPDWS